MAKDLEQINELIVKGQSSLAKKELRLYISKAVPRELRVQAASLARRLSLPLIGLRLLHPYVRPSGKLLAKATEEEVAEYAANLSFIGAAEEAIKLLSPLNHARIPQAQLFLAFAHFSQWDYQTPLNHLRNYVQSRGITDYQRLVGKVNLLAGLVYERMEAEASFLIQELIKLTHDGSFFLLNGNTHELAAQLAISQMNYSEARLHLKASFEALKQTDHLDSFYVAKWHVIANLLESKASKASLLELAQIREAAIKKKNWETLRDCDRYEAISRKDQPLLQKVYFGTPYPSFRNRLLADFGKGYSISEFYDWTIGPVLEQSNPHFQIITETGVFHSQSRKCSLKLGQSLHRLLLTLCMDFYRPMKIAVLHHHLFPNEYFHPTASPHKVQEIIRRFRAWANANKFPIEIHESRAFYQLRAAKPISIRTKITEQSCKREDLMLQALRVQLENAPLSVKSVSSFLNISKRSALRLLQSGRESGSLMLVGKGPSSKYHWKT